MDTKHKKKEIIENCGRIERKEKELPNSSASPPERDGKRATTSPRDPTYRKTSGPPYAGLGLHKTGKECETSRKRNVRSVKKKVP